MRRDDHGQPFYAAVLEGACRLAIDGEAEIVLTAGDFVLIPAASAFAASSLVAPSAGRAPPVKVGPGVFRLGPPEMPPDLRMLVGNCTFASDDVDLLLSLLPRFVHVRGVGRLAMLLGLVNEESRAHRPGREVVLARLLEVLLIEALRSTTGPTAPSGLLRGLADERLAAALRRMHERPTVPWMVAALAREAGLSRSTFFERFRREVGVAPMAYLLAWRIALAKDLLGREGAGVAEVAERVGYGCASTFSTAFARYVGRPPIHYAREQRAQPRSPAPLNV
ncbi:AraC family transcriptional regulator [Methylobacterium brachiatum]|uniref:AraC family transcriptional regulator n=1 Tax=Methylobacterium brachiatum TaxID=269660 RepID=UPI0026A70142